MSQFLHTDEISDDDNVKAIAVHQRKVQFLKLSTIPDTALFFFEHRLKTTYHNRTES